MSEVDILESLDVPKLIWGTDARVEARGPNIFVFLLTRDIVRNLAFRQGGGMLPIRRTMYKNCRAWYELFGKRYPHLIPVNMISKPPEVKPTSFSYDGRLHVDSSIAEEMIRSGVLHMLYGKTRYQQNLYWADDPWYQRNLAGTFQLHML